MILKGELALPVSYSSAVAIHYISEQKLKKCDNPPDIKIILLCAYIHNTFEHVQ